jgi:hypothetical protein
MIIESISSITQMRSLSLRDLLRQAMINVKHARIVRIVMQERCLRSACQGPYELVEQEIAEEEDENEDSVANAQSSLPLHAISRPLHAIKDCRQEIIAVQLNLAMPESATTALLASGWDYTDPEGYTHKSPEDIKDFLTCMSSGFEIELYKDMHPSRRALLKVIFDTYLRALRHNLRGG